MVGTIEKPKLWLAYAVLYKSLFLFVNWSYQTLLLEIVNIHFLHFASTGFDPQSLRAVSSLIDK